jgi:cytochrome b561
MSVPMTWPAATGARLLPTALRVLHAVLAVLLGAALALGWFGLGPAEGGNAARQIDLLRWHMAGGALIAALTVLRLAVRWRAPPPALSAGCAWSLLARCSRDGSYLLVALLVATGFATALGAGLPDIVFGGSGQPVPAGLAQMPSRMAHAALAATLALCVLLHVLTVLYRRAATR